jgi:hypothetical protein
MSPANDKTGPPAPPAPTPSHSNFNLFNFLSREKLTGPNYLDWIRSLRIGLRYEDKEYVLDNNLPQLPKDPTEAELAAYHKHDEESTKVACLMLATMSSELQKSFENVGAFDMNFQLQEMFQEQARQERFETVRSLMACKHMEGTSVCAHVQKMKGYIDRLENLGVQLLKELAIDMVLNSLSSQFHQFILNYNMNNLDKTMMELHDMLKTAESSMVKTKSPTYSAPVLAIQGAAKKGKVSHPRGKGKAKVGQSNQASRERSTPK